MDKQNRQEDKVSDIANNIGSSTSEAVQQAVTALQNLAHEPIWLNFMKER